MLLKHTGNVLKVVVIHPERIIYEGEAKAVTGINDKGRFDILPMHSNFVSLIKDRVIINEIRGGKKQLPIERAILKVFENQVWIFVGISEEILAGSPKADSSAK